MTGKIGWPLPAWIALDDAKACSLHLEFTAKCASCLWHSKRLVWQKVFTMQATLSLQPGADQQAHEKCISKQLLQRPWIESAVVDGRFGLGCVACACLPSGMITHRHEFSSFTKCSARTDLLVKHQATSQHKMAVAHLLGLQTTSKGTPIHPAAPIGDEVRQCYQSLRKGGSCRNGQTSSDRTHNLRWAVAEAFAEQDRIFMRKAKAIQLSRDERHGRILVRFIAVNQSLERRHGTIGVFKGQSDASAETLVNITKELLKQFCTRRLHCPRGLQLEGDERDFRLGTPSSGLCTKHLSFAIDSSPKKKSCLNVF